jgi:hypothetical protein
MSIDKINGVSIRGTQATAAANRINRANTASSSNIKAYEFKDRSPRTELPLPNGRPTLSIQETITLADILSNLLFDILLDGCTIASRGALVNQDSTIEASFQPPIDKNQTPIMFLPIPCQKLSPVDHSRSYNRDAIQQKVRIIVHEFSKEISSKQLVKLIILTAHEYGHLKSFYSGAHDQSLLYGISLLDSRSANADLVYPVSAWRFAEQMLLQQKFTLMEQFNLLKYESLAAYFKLLHLADASIPIYCNLSLLGIDLNYLDNHSRHKAT